jgi:hypothetical protein
MTRDSVRRTSGFVQVGLGEVGSSSEGLRFLRMSDLRASREGISLKFALMGEPALYASIVRDYNRQGGNRPHENLSCILGTSSTLR